ncbi:hypothetical protein YC2023_086338 [Brassica napus]|uniref:(rape) hypothetical protein n=1 Tax=Brassica napus TaxID=3708 RepID=A0A816MTU4_BRANA|nr:unnamed protein product [Brassica napus]
MMSHIISALPFDILSEMLKLKAKTVVLVCVFRVRAITPTNTLSFYFFSDEDKAPPPPNVLFF